MKYKIIFIDEDQEMLDHFMDFVEASSHKGIITPIPLLPLGEIDEMITAIIELNPDVVITDFMLNDSRESINYNVSYNGSELIDHFQGIRDGFPCFVMTALDDKAINESNDVNIVYVKNIMYEDENEQKAKASFLDRVIKQVEHYKSRIETAENTLVELITKRAITPLTIKEEKHLLELDDFLERSVDKRHSIPVEYKTLSNSDKLSQLINSVDKLIEEIDGKNDN